MGPHIHIHGNSCVFPQYSYELYDYESPWAVWIVNCEIFPTSYPKCCFSTGFLFEVHTAHRNSMNNWKYPWIHIHTAHICFFEFMEIHGISYSYSWKIHGLQIHSHGNSWVSIFIVMEIHEFTKKFIWAVWLIWSHNLHEPSEFT